MRIVLCSCSWTSADISKMFQGHLAELAEEKRWRQRARSASPSLPRSRRCSAAPESPVFPRGGPANRHRSESEAIPFASELRVRDPVQNSSPRIKWK